MSATLLDKPKHQQFLGETLPVVIHIETEYRRLPQAAAQLMEKPGEEIGEEEGRLLEMLGMLIEEYEDRRHPLPQTEPHKMLSYEAQRSLESAAQEPRFGDPERRARHRQGSGETTGGPIRVPLELFL